MGRLKTPQQKKSEAYQHDRIESAESHADRRNRPQVKARTHRRLRRKTKQLLRSEPEETVQLPARLERGWQRWVHKLGEHVQSRKLNRIEREANNIFKRGYSLATHARFRAIIETWLNGKGEYSATLAKYYRDLLNGFPSDERGYGPRTARRYFLKRFFILEPQLHRRFRRWIDSLTAAHPIM